MYKEIKRIIIKTFKAMLNIKDFTTALEIISKSHSTELAINIPKNNFVGNIGQT